MAGDVLKLKDDTSFSTLCSWFGLLTCKTHYGVGEPTAAGQFVDIRQHRSFDNGWQYVSCGQRQPPLSGAPVNKMAVNYHKGETDPSRFRVWWNSLSLRDIFVPPYRQLSDGLVITTTSSRTSLLRRLNSALTLTLKSCALWYPVSLCRPSSQANTAWPAVRE